MQEFFEKYIKPTEREYLKKKPHFNAEISSKIEEISAAILKITKDKPKAYSQVIEHDKIGEISADCDDIIVEMRAELILKFNTLSKYFKQKGIRWDLSEIKGKNRLEILDKLIFRILGETRYSVLQYASKGEKKHPLSFFREKFQMDENHIWKYSNDQNDFQASSVGDFVWQQVLLKFAPSRKEGFQKMMQKIFGIEVFIPSEIPIKKDISYSFYGKRELLQNPKKFYTEFFEQAFGQEESERIRKIIQSFRTEQKKIPHSLLKKDFGITTERFGNYKQYDIVPSKNPQKYFKWITILSSFGRLSLKSIAEYIQIVFDIEVDLEK